MAAKVPYSYCGAVTSFGSTLAHTWRGRTRAVSKQKARSNLAFQFKQEMGLVPDVPVSLPGEVTEGWA